MGLGKAVRYASSLLAILFVLFSVPAMGATHTWIGPANGLWSNNANWTGGKPTSGENGGTIVQFGASSTSIMDISNLVVDQIVFTGNGNTIGGTSGIKLTISSSVLGSNINNMAGTNSLDFSLPIGLTGTNDIFFVAGAGTLQLKSTVSGTNNVRISTATGAQVTYLGTKTYTGLTGISAGTLSLSSAGVDNAVAGDIVIGTGSGAGAKLFLGASFEIANTSSVTVNSDGTFDLNNKAETIGSLVVSGGSVLLGSGGLSLGGALNMSGGTITGTATLNLGGDITATSGSGTGTATIGCPITLNGTRTFTVNPGTQFLDLTLSGVIADGGAASGLIKSGAGTLIFNQSSDNTYSGETNVYDGVLLLTGSSANLIPFNNLIIGDGVGSAGSAEVRLGAANKLNDGIGVLLKSDGLLNLNGFNESVDNLGLVGGTVTVGSATLSLTSSVLCLQVQAGSLTAANGGSLVLKGNVAGITPFGDPTITSNITLGANITFDIPAFSTPPQLTINGVISDGGNGFGITKTGTGTLQIAGATGNTFTGTTTVNQGVLELNQAGGESIVGPLTIGNNTDPGGTAIVRDVNHNFCISTSTALTINSSGTLDLNTFSDNCGVLSGTGKVVIPQGSSLTVNPATNATSTFSGTISGAGQFVKNGPGTLTLTGANTLSGTVKCLAGTLELNCATSNACIQADPLIIGDNIGGEDNAIVKLLASDQIRNQSSVQVNSSGLLDLNNFSESFIGFTVGGNVNLGTGSLLLGASLKLEGNAFIAPSSGTLKLNGDIIAKSFLNVITAAVELNSNRTISVEASSIQPELFISGVIGDGLNSSGIAKTGAGALRIEGPGSQFTGTTTVTAGTLELNCFATAAIPNPLIIGNNTDPAGTAIVKNLTTVDIASDVTVNKSGRLDCNNFGQNIGTLTGSGEVLIGTSGFFVGETNGTGTFSGVISGTGSVSKAGTGHQTFTGNNTYTGTTFINTGELTINGQQSGGFQVAIGAVLSGSGKIGSLFNSGTLEPSGAPFSATGVTFSATGKLNITLNSVTPGAFSSLNAAGTVVINTGATLNFTTAPGIVPKTDSKFVLIANDAADAITGTFANAAATIAGGSKVFSVNYAGGTGNDLEITATANSAPVISSPASATPNPVGSNQTVFFLVAASDSKGDTLTFTWDFGDGSTGTGATPTHTYSATGTFTATVTVSDGQGGVATSSVDVVVGNFLIGEGPDTDGDGFSDSFETAAGTLIIDGNSFPVFVNPIQTLVVSKLGIKLNFAKPALNDSITFSGTLPIPAGFSVTDKKVVLDVGGVAKGFTLSSKGVSVGGDKNNVFKVTIKSSKGVVAAQTAKYSVTLKSGTFAAHFADEGLISKNDKGSLHGIYVIVLFNEVVRVTPKTVNYKATLGKSGSAQ